MPKAQGASRTVLPDEHAIHGAAGYLVAAGVAPAGFVIDFGVTQDGRIVLVEMNDGFSVGAHDGIAAVDYWCVTAARWFELMNT